MSRIGRQPIAIPAGVTVQVSESNLVTVKGPKGTLSQQVNKDIKIEEKDGQLEAYEFKWKNKDVKLPKTFVESYPGTPLNVINPESYADFVSV